MAYRLKILKQNGDLERVVSSTSAETVEAARVRLAKEYPGCKIVNMDSPIPASYVMPDDEELYGKNAARIQRDRMREDRL